jgi:hypothetical protein
VTAVDVREFQKKLARKAVRDAIEKCVKNAGSEFEKRRKCYTDDDDVKESYSTWMGKDSSDTQTDEISEIIRESERTVVNDAMRACMEGIQYSGVSGSTMRDMMSKCRLSSSKKALEKLGKNATAMEINDLIENGAKNAVTKAMRAANKAKVSEKEKSNEIKKVLGLSLGKAAENISDSEVQKYVREGAEGEIKRAMSSCTELALYSQHEADKTSKLLRECRKTSAKTALVNSLGKENITDVEVERFIRKGAQESAVEAIKAKISGKDGLLSASERVSAAKEALKKALGKETISDVEASAMLNKGAQESVTEATQSCVKSSQSEEERRRCKAGVAKDALRLSLGRDVSEEEVEAILNKGSSEAAAQAMSDAINAGSDPDSRNERVREVLKSSLAKLDVSNAEVNVFVNDGAKLRVESEMKSCYERAHDEDNAKDRIKILKKCRELAKKTLADSLGKDEKTVTETDVVKTIQDAAKNAATAAMQAAKDASIHDAKEKFDAVKKAIKSTLAAETIEDEEVTLILKSGAKESVANTMTNCYNVAMRQTDVNSRGAKLHACKRESVKKAMQDILGKNHVQPEDVEELVQDAAQSAVRKAMSAETRVGTEEKERMDNLKKVLQKALGKTTVLAKEVTKFVREGAKQAAQETMSACYAQVKDKGLKKADSMKGLKDCKDTEVKQALANSLGKAVDQVSKVDVERFVRDGARDAIVDVMEAVVDTGTKKSKAEIREIGRKKLASALGLNISDIKGTKVEIFKLKGARRKASKRMKACVTSAKERFNGNATDAAKQLRKKAIRRCRRTAIQNSIQKAMGNRTISKAKCKEIVQNGARDSIINAREACMIAAQGNATEIGKCSSDHGNLKAVLADALGKDDASEVDDADVEEYVFAGAEMKATETLIACSEGGISDAECKANLNFSMSLVLGKETAAIQGRRLAKETASLLTERDITLLVLKGASMYVRDKMLACVEASDHDATKALCYENDDIAQEALSEATNTELGKIKPEDVKRVKEEAAVKAYAQTNEAIFDEDADREEAKTAGDEVEPALKQDEIEKAREESTKTCGIDMSKKKRWKHRIQQQAGSLKAAAALKACAHTKMPAHECKDRIQRSWDRASGSKPLSTWQPGRQLAGGESIKCEVCSKIADKLAKMLIKRGCTWAIDAEAATWCEGALGGPEDPLADTCAVLLIADCKMLAGLVNKEANKHRKGSEFLCEHFCTHSYSNEMTNTYRRNRFVAKRIMKDSLRAGGQVNLEELTNFGARVLLRHRLATRDELSMDEEAKKAFEMIREQKFEKAEQRTVKQEVAGSKFSDVIKVNRNDPTKYRLARDALATELKGLARPSTETELEEVITRKELDVVDEEDTCDDEDLQECKKEIQDDMAQLHRKVASIPVRKLYNARRKAALEWSDCEEAGNKDDFCKQRAKDVFARKGGLAWEQTEFKIKKMKEKIRKGEPLRIKRKQQIDICVKYKTSKCLASQKQLKDNENDLEKAVKSQDANAVYIRIIEEDDTHEDCNVCWKVKLSEKSSRSADEVDEVAEKVRTYVKSANDLRKRRRLSSSETEVYGSGSIDIGDVDDNIDFDPENKNVLDDAAQGIGMYLGMVGGAVMLSLVVYYFVRKGKKQYSRHTDVDGTATGSVEMPSMENPMFGKMHSSNASRAVSITQPPPPAPFSGKPAPEETWEVFYTDDGKPYYHNKRTNETCWENPME